MTLSLADEIRANTAAIVAQLRGFSKQPPHLQKVTLAASYFTHVADKIEELQAEVNAPQPCAECGTHSNLFEIDTRRDRPCDAELLLKRMKRMREEDGRAAGAREMI